MIRRAMMALALVGWTALAVAQQAQPQKQTIDGIRNFTSVDPTVACAGATEARVMPELARRGYRAVINLRQATEEGAAIDDSRRAAEAAGIRFIHLPLNSQAPDAATAGAFLKAVADPANQPTFINCASANRAAALLLIKRLLLDEWSEQRAREDATLVGLTNARTAQVRAGVRLGQQALLARSQRVSPTLNRTFNVRVRSRRISTSSV
jgi:uncharacterized protein (TIGR01244 family)